MRRTLLLVWHSRTGHAEQMAAAIERGAISAAAEMGSELAGTAGGTGGCPSKRIDGGVIRSIGTNVHSKRAGRGSP